MSYVPKTDWNNNDVLSEKDMNRIEGGIAEWRQLTEDHTVDKNNPHGVTVEQIGAETPTGAQEKVDAHKNATLEAHAASSISVADTVGRFTTKNVEGALAELATQQAQLFTSVGDGKAQVATAITAKGGTVVGTAPHSFQELDDGIRSIVTGKRFASGLSDTVLTSGRHKISIRGLNFTPRVVVGYSGNGSICCAIQPSAIPESTWRNYYNYWDSGGWRYTFTTSTGPDADQFQRLNGGFDMILARGSESIIGTRNEVFWWAFE
ncbi:hypothetical protein CIG75_12670 [Tumebacillus algifaecis]|uniref:Uncharacterized protein n=1 Tax=Tumebacillus algifaecis TaxID=1214604 RepID=A0A223D2C0_9BACL|nr:hypothetical protein [Tumebacillus algifaecis]ASS75752.1 hypothetical protein CIG75_12670 [Tumebacillus algifaecis]